MFGIGVKLNLEIIKVDKHQTKFYPEKPRKSDKCIKLVELIYFYLEDFCRFYDN